MIKEVYLKWMLRPIVKHRVPGRLRIHIPALLDASKEFQAKATTTVEKITLPGGIKSLKVSFTTGNILIHFNTNETTEGNVLEWVDQLSTVAFFIWEKSLQLPVNKQPLVVSRLITFLDKTIEEKKTLDNQLYLPDEIWS